MLYCLSMSEQFTHQTYLSPFTWRYGSEAMRHIWGETHKRQLWRQLWVALAQAQQQAGLVTQAQVDDLREHLTEIDVARAHQIEVQIHHDLMAEVKTYAEQCEAGGGIIHLGATSMDIEDNADALRLRQSLDLILGQLDDQRGFEQRLESAWAESQSEAELLAMLADLEGVLGGAIETYQTIRAKSDDLSDLLEAIDEVQSS